MQIRQLTRHATDFQQPVDERLLTLALTSLFDGDPVRLVNELGTGLFNNTYDVLTQHDRYVLKVAPATNAHTLFNEQHLMQREEQIAATLEQASSLIPRYLQFFNIGHRRAFLQPFVEGTLWHDVFEQLSDTENAQLWFQLGEFNRALHQHTNTVFGYPTSDSGHSTWYAFIHHTVEGLIQNCHQYGVYSRDIECYQNQLTHFNELLNQVTTAHLLHGDIWPRNVIIAGENEHVHIKAVIDGERAYWG